MYIYRLNEITPLVTGVTAVRTPADLYLPPPSKSASGYGSLFAGLDYPNKISFEASFISYLETNSIGKLFVDVLFNHNSKFRN